MRPAIRTVMSCLMLGAAAGAVADVADPNSLQHATPPRPATAAGQLAASQRVLAVGDSLTAGYNVARADSYPAVLARRLNIAIDNRGISGETSTGLLRRLPALLKAQRYDTVVLCTGGNDWLRGLSAQQLQTNLERAIALIRDSGATPVLMAVPMLPLAVVDHPVYAQVAADQDVVLIGGFGLVLGPQHFQADGLHPNAAGYRQIVERLLAS